MDKIKVIYKFDMTEANLATSKGFQVNAGFTVQSSLYKEPEQWSETVELQRNLFRASSNYDYITAYKHNNCTLVHQEASWQVPSLRD